MLNQIIFIFIGIGIVLDQLMVEATPNTSATSYGHYRQEGAHFEINLNEMEAQNAASYGSNDGYYKDNFNDDDEDD